MLERGGGRRRESCFGRLATLVGEGEGEVLWESDEEVQDELELERRWAGMGGTGGGACLGMLRLRLRRGKAGSS